MKLHPEDMEPGAPFELLVDGTITPFQFTGAQSPGGAEIMIKLGFAKGEEKDLEFREIKKCVTVVGQKNILMKRRTLIGGGKCKLSIPLPQFKNGCVNGPFSSFNEFPMESSIHCDAKFIGASLALVNDGPLFSDYELKYEFADFREYRLSFRFYKLDSFVEVSEYFSLRMDAELVWKLNPEKIFTHIISRDNFEGETQPSVEPLGKEHPRDVLCRLQMPVLSEYVIPNNRGWFAFCDSRNEARGMMGILGLYGSKWVQPVEGMPIIYDSGETVEWRSSLESGSRFWMLYAGKVEKQYSVISKSIQKPTPDPRPPTSPASDGRFVFHRLHAEFNALRLDEHLDLAGQQIYDSIYKDKPGFFPAGDFHAAARERAAKLKPLRKYIDNGGNDWSKVNSGAHDATLKALLNPTRDNHREVYNYLVRRFEKWVREFQGCRAGEHDYAKNVIGFTRWLRGMLLAYEMLCRDNALSEEQKKTMGSYFVFAARRITDEGRWPHSRTALHPDHPESTRDFYNYGGEHRADRIYWTNCLPNFQSDPLCALAHISAVFAEHPDSGKWRKKALDDIECHLDAYCGKSGAWVESINYALYTFSYFIITFKVLKEYCGINYFQDRRMRSFASWLVHYLGPKDKRWDKYTYPGIGNAICPSGGGEYLLCYANELEEDDILRGQLIAVYQKMENYIIPTEHYPLAMAVMSPIPDKKYELLKLESENMDEVGVSMRHRHLEEKESWLFQKIGFAKEHYESDETSFNWYAKGTPFSMDYGTYTSDVAVGAAHNAIDIPDLDSLRRGYLADHLFSRDLDFTRCEMPVTLKLLWGRVRNFDEIDGKDGVIDRNKTPYFYIGDDNPVGPKTWKTRVLFFVKPDYVAVFDRVYGDVPHRYCFHFTGDKIGRKGPLITGKGKFDLDLLAYVQHPDEFLFENGRLVPNYEPYGDKNAKFAHAQDWFRIRNVSDGIYRTLIFAKEKNRKVKIGKAGKYGMRIETESYVDYIFMHNDVFEDALPDGIAFSGRYGWIRRKSDGEISATVTDGNFIQAFGKKIEGRGPFTFNVDERNKVVLKGGPPRHVAVGFN